MEKIDDMQWDINLPDIIVKVSELIRGYNELVDGYNELKEKVDGYIE